MNKIIKFDYMLNDIKLKLFYNIINYGSSKRLPITYIEKKYGVEKFNGIYCIVYGELKIGINKEYLIIFNKLILERKLKINSSNKKVSKI